MTFQICLVFNKGQSVVSFLVSVCGPLLNNSIRFVLKMDIDTYKSMCMVQVGFVSNC